MIHGRCIPIFLLFTYWRIPRPGDQMKQTCISWGFHLWNYSFLDFHNYYLPSLVSFLQLYVVPEPAAQPCSETTVCKSTKCYVLETGEKNMAKMTKEQRMSIKFHCAVTHLIMDSYNWLTVCLSRWLPTFCLQLILPK